ncbi:SAM-dependent methyltransferase [Corynebacterium aquatimens]|uniref:THUMP-like domain-containing protein n=1 Tax=Corynebacterium TaxID=1716 RepID=UPI001F15F538|nr:MULTISPECIES: SAM-dependent methyltransferase [Corynebacterium]QYH19864.1 SAM-dependent methyltransferase [Corynebacterium aquatimens]UIZ92981.1 SAM-dependent methyltransferase [Corynebacterium sp. CNCTC7651]
MSFTLEEVAFLAANAERIAAVAPEIALTKQTVFADRALLERKFGPEYARAVSVLVAAQRVSVGKHPSSWLTDYDAAQQATPRAVADVRARHVAAAGAQWVHDVTCSVGSEAPAFAAAGVGWLGSDLDRSRLAMARHNLGPDAWLACADALAPVSAAPVVVADPARRADGRRITDPAKLIPPLPDFLAAHAGRELAVKCAPGIDYSEWEGLVSVVSLDGGVKEACLYTPGIAGRGREAVVLRSDGFEERCLSTDPDSAPVAEPGPFIVEPDGAIVRAGLVRQWAARHGLWMLDEHIAFLSGDAVPAGYSGFPFIEAVPLKRLKAALSAHGAGSVEILVRGVDVDPDKLRPKLKLKKGGRPMAVVIARIGDAAVAHVCGARVHVPAGAG